MDGYLDDDSVAPTNDALNPLARIARPPAASTIPPATLRGLRAPSASAAIPAAPPPTDNPRDNAASPALGEGEAPGSTADLENRAFAARIARPNQAPPSLWDQHLAVDQARQKELDKGSGLDQFSQRHHILGPVLRGLSIAGSIVAPGAAMMIPGTDLHHGLLEAENRRALNNDLGQQKTLADTAETGARTEQAEAEAAKANAEAKVAGNAKQGLTPEEVTIHNLMTGQNGQPRVDPQTGQPYTYFGAYSAVMGAKEGAKPNEKPVGDASAKQYNDSILRELNINPKTQVKTVPPEYQVNAGDTDAQAKEKLQRAKDLVSGATGQQKIIVGEGNQGNARLDRSYDLQAKRIDAERTPIKQIATRMSNLQTTLDQKNPQADALVAPELLSIMSGGQGSGLRMNEAEISRIAGGRSAWENLKAQMQHWSTNPDSARSITPEQDKQIRALVSAVQTKIAAKMQAIEAADDALLDAEDIKSQRKITADLRKQLDSIDAGQAGGGGGKDLGPAPDGKAEGSTGTMPDGTKVVVKGGRLISQ